MLIVSPSIVRKTVGEGSSVKLSDTSLHSSLFSGKLKPHRPFQFLATTSISQSTSLRAAHESLFSNHRFKQIITNTTEIAEQFNLYFSNNGKDLATEIPPTDVEPECYLKPSTETFSLKNPTVGEVHNLLRKLNVRKATGLDKIPCKLLKVAADVIAPSPTKIYQRSIIRGIFPLEWKLARVTPVFK